MGIPQECLCVKARKRTRGTDMRFENDPQLKIIRSGISLILAILVVLGLAAPGITLERQEPADPLEDQQVQDVTVLQVGEDLLQDSPIRIPSEERIPEEETTPPETEEETQPEEEPETQPEEIPATQPGGETEQEGSEDGTQGELTGDPAAADLAMVLYWYPYGRADKEEGLSCSPMGTKVKSINTSRLDGNTFRYRFTPEGEDAGNIRRFAVSYREGNGTFQSIDEEGALNITIPEAGESRQDTFQIHADYLEAGSKTEQKVTFTFTIQWENRPDLELDLRWKKDGEWAEVACTAGSAVAFTVNNSDLVERHFQYQVTLSGEGKDDAKLTQCLVTSDENPTPVSWDPESGIETLQTADSKDSQTYYLKFTVDSPAGELTFTYRLTYRETPDVKLQFLWRGKDNASRTELISANGEKTLEIRSNQLSAGAIAYEMELTGQNGGAAQIKTVTYSSEPGKNQGSNGSLSMALHNGETEQSYTLNVSVQVWNQILYYTIHFHVTSDVMLQMNYTVDGQGCFATCENGKTVETEIVYDDQLSGGQLSYSMELLGTDSGDLTIQSVELFREGDGRIKRLEESGTAELLLNGGKKGLNTFTIMAEGNGESYSFTIVVPYKHRGSEGVTIETNLQDGQTIINETETNLTVSAWSLDENGNKVYITPVGTDTRLVVTLDGEEVPNLGLEYALYPKNPEVGDSNTHTLYIYAENAYGEYGEKEITLMGQRQQQGQVAGIAAIYVDMTVLGLGVYGPVSYEVLADEPVSYTVVKAVLGQDTGEPFGAAADTFGWSGRYSGTLDIGFYLQSLSTGFTPDTLENSMWPGNNDEEVLSAIDARFGARSNLATLWRCIYRNGLNKSPGSNGAFGEQDYTNGSGWLYAIGNETYYPGQSMSEIRLKDGDILTLRFTLAYGWDVGGGTEGYGNTAGYCVTALNGNWNIHHVMEDVTDENGVTHQVCRCCGLVEDCTHVNRYWQDQQDGTHVEYCPDCQSMLTEPAYHTWDENAGAGDSHYCPLCGCEEAHIWRELEGSTATCTESGSANFVCDICGIIREETVEPLGHTLDNRWNYDLQEHYRVCSRCQEEFDRGSHDYVYDSGWEDFLCQTCGVLHAWDAECGGEMTMLSATCQQIRYLCSGCGYELVKTGTFEEYHSYDGNGYCSYCGQQDPDIHVHSYVLTAAEPAGCETEGYQTYQCDCGESYSDSIPATGHDWTDWETVIDPEDEESSVLWHYCLNCGQEEYDSLPPVSTQDMLRKILRYVWP